MCKHCEDDPSLAEYYHGCSCCGRIPDDDGECDCPPEGYIKPGQEAFLYVNAYEVTRHYGGPEEGGWYFNHHEPIASIPIKAISVAGHDDVCYTCGCARRGDKYPTGELYEECRWGFHLKVVDENQKDMFKDHLESLFGDRREGDIYSVLGGTDVIVCIEDHVGEREPRPRYE